MNKNNISKMNKKNKTLSKKFNPNMIKINIVLTINRLDSAIASTNNNKSTMNNNNNNRMRIFINKH